PLGLFADLWLFSHRFRGGLRSVVPSGLLNKTPSHSWLSPPYVSAYAAAAMASSTSAGSIGTPGPIVDVSVTFLTYLPLAAAGLAFRIAPIRACALAASLAPSKLTLPIGEWIMP